MKTTLFMVLLSALAGTVLIVARKDAEPECGGCTVSGERSNVLRVAPDAEPPRIPGDPENAAKAFRNLYQALIGYRDLHGHLPKRTRFIRVTDKPIAPGVVLRQSDLNCVDAESDEYASSSPKQASKEYLLTWKAPRPDGTPKPDFPKKGERDLWALSMHYERSRTVKAGGQSFVQYFGVVVGLFSDGSVSITPVDQMLAVQRNEASWRRFFPQETGLPAAARPVSQLSKIILDSYRSRSK